MVIGSRFWRCLHSMRRGLCNGTVSVCPSVRLSYRPAAGACGRVYCCGPGRGGDIDPWRRPPGAAAQWRNYNFCAPPPANIRYGLTVLIHNSGQFWPPLPFWAPGKTVKGKRSTAVRKKPHRYGNSRAIWDHTVLPATRQR